MADAISDAYFATRAEIIRRLEDLKGKQAKYQPINKDAQGQYNKAYEKMASGRLGGALKKLPLATYIDLWGDISEAFAICYKQAQDKSKKELDALKKAEKEENKRLTTMIELKGEALLDMEIDFLERGLTLDERKEQLKFLKIFKDYESSKEKQRKNEAEALLSDRIRNWHDLTQEQRDAKLREIGYEYDDSLIAKIDDTIAKNIAKDYADDKIVTEAKDAFIEYSNTYALTPRTSSVRPIAPDEPTA